MRYLKRIGMIRISEWNEYKELRDGQVPSPLGNVPFKELLRSTLRDKNVYFDPSQKWMNRDDENNI